MAVEIKFDTANRPELPTLILTKKSGDRIGVINNVTDIRFSDNLNSPPEISFTVHKRKNGRKCKYWFALKSFRLIYIPEWKKYFEIYVSINESNENTKNVSGVALQETELSNAYLYDIEINTEDDIAREDYEVTTLYNSDNPKASLLNRILSDKASYYSILHVDSSIADIQRSFSFDGVTIYDAFMKIAEEIDCIFIFGEPSDESPMMRTISVYDLESSCKECGYRGEFTETCPNCGSLNIYEGYGDDTTIFLSRENLTEDITLTSDTDSVKNCFRLEAGDDLMTASIINANPSGSQYIWHISDDDKAEMSDGLQEKLNTYNEKYDYYQKEYKANLNSNTINAYNVLVNKYRTFDKTLEPIITPVTGYSSLMTIYYNAIDFHSYLYNTLMPSVDTSGTTAKDQADLLTSVNLSPVSVQNINYISLATANSTILAYAKVFIDTARYKIKVKDSSISGTTWIGSFTVENYYDDEDVADSQTITIQFNDNYENFIKQKLDKALIRSEDPDLSIVGLFTLENDAFAEELKKYSYTYLQIIADSCQSCLDILIEQGIGDNESWTYTEGNLYDGIYVPYYNKKALIESEIIIRENEIAVIAGTTDEYGDVAVKGLKNYIDDIRTNILDELNFEKYIGEHWAELCSFRREDTWSNDNYISDGLSNSELFKNAQDFLSSVKKEIYKASTLQHSISTTLKNLLIIEEFKPLVKFFKTGNWLRIQVDDEIYKLRLLNYEIKYDSLKNLPVEFSDVVKKIDTISDVESILNQSKSMAKTYTSVKRQAEQGSQGKDLVDDILVNGLDVANTYISNGENQEVLYDKHGILLRKYNPDDGTYSPKQIKFLNNIISMTTDNWKTSKLALGEFDYFNPKTQQTEKGYGLIASQIVGGLMLSEEIGIYNKSGSLTIDDSGLNITNGTNTFSVNPNSSSFLTIKKGNVPVFTVSDTGELSFTGNVTTENLSLGTNGLYENNGTTSISIAPTDISILTLQKGTEKVFYFNESGELNIKANITATNLILEDIKLNASNIDGIDNYVKKDLAVGSSPAPNTTTDGFLLSSTGSMHSRNAILYNPTIYTSNLTVESGGLSVQNKNDEKILWVSDSGDINLLDEWKTSANIVTSGTDNKVKINLNGDNLEIWVNKTLIATLPKGYSPSL